MLGEVKKNRSAMAGIRYRSDQSTTASVSDRDEDDEVHRYRYKLYQYKICPFSNIAKVFLNYQMIPFESIEVNPLTKAELGFSDKYRKVPIVTVLDTDPHTPATNAGQQLNGTEEILLHRHFTATNNDDDSFASSESSLQWQDFARTKLAPLLYPNICRTLGDSFRAFHYVHATPNGFSGLQKYSIQYVGSVAMYFAASKIQKKYNIDNVEVALDETLVELESALSTTTGKFLHLDEPDLGDLAVFGVLKGLEGLPLWNAIFDPHSKYPKLRQWYSNVNDAVEIRKARTKRYGYND